ncbi:4'-phosphopantetheinyl transferase superfamily protein [Agrococcus sp. HG114]|uniref:4'-phosphopantetheinyl transferase family protein n=1 Tax=Agrococcus sp. HG114 TaxID=2969757 RepID=UPI00215ACE78|nr:4'-phosphopantetheinyl transferase superfamily protein [Agrococcus sp. HG114]MCR8670098.1 4-phosphopantetheinyl transferase [Agrococcus sp. HG114]
MRVADAVVERVRGSRAAAHDALRALVGRLAGVDEASVVVVQRCPDCGGPHGRPVVMEPWAARGIGVSLAHAGEEHVVAAARGRRIGVDAERADAPPERLAAVRQLLDAHDEPLRRWTRVEAVLKADGRGLRVDPSEVEVDDASAIARGPGGDRAYALHDVEVGGGLVVTLAIDET